MEPWNKGKRLPPDPLTPEEARHLIAINADSRTPSGRKQYAMLVTLWRAGLRADELLSLQLCDYRAAGGDLCTIRVMRPKGSGRGKAPREVGLDTKACEAIRRWVAVRGQREGYLFCAQRSGKKMSPSWLRKMVAREAKRARIHRRVSPHSLRHTFALELYRERVGMVHIMDAMGHTSLNMTANYLRGLGASEVVEITAGREW